MLLNGYDKRIFRPTCNSGLESVHCIATLHEDVGDALPFLNAVLGGKQYFSDPPELLLHHYGKVITVGARQIAINALEDDTEAEKILQWLKREINSAWEKRERLSSRKQAKSVPEIMQIYKLLPQTNCEKCSQPTCMVFAAHAASGGFDVGDCPELSADKQNMLTVYLSGFDFG